MFDHVNVATAVHRLGPLMVKYKPALASPEFAVLKKLAGEVSQLALAGPSMQTVL